MTTWTQGERYMLEDGFVIVGAVSGILQYLYFSHTWLCGPRGLRRKGG